MDVTAPPRTGQARRNLYRNALHGWDKPLPQPLPSRPPSIGCLALAHPSIPDVILDIVVTASAIFPEPDLFELYWHPPSMAAQLDRAVWLAVVRLKPRVFGRHGWWYEPLPTTSPPEVIALMREDTSPYYSPGLASAKVIDAVRNTSALKDMRSKGEAVLPTVALALARRHALRHLHDDNDRWFRDDDAYGQQRKTKAIERVARQRSQIERLTAATVWPKSVF
jgi:hypothetical protein